MKELLMQYAAFNVWANKKLIDAILQLSDAQQQQEITSSFPGIYKTLMHIWDAESIWWQRMNLQENFFRPSSQLTTIITELADGLDAQSKQWKEWVSAADEIALHHVFAYRNIKGEPFESQVWQVLQHLFNHGTYHRGQLVTMLRQVGITTIPATDFIAFTRV